VHVELRHHLVEERPHAAKNLAERSVEVARPE
jgi:hypothetical protein